MTPLSASRMRRPVTSTAIASQSRGPSAQVKRRIRLGVAWSASAAGSATKISLASARRPKLSPVSAISSQDCPASW